MKRGAHSLPGPMIVVLILALDCLQDALFQSSKWLWEVFRVDVFFEENRIRAEASFHIHPVFRFGAILLVQTKVPQVETGRFYDER